MTTVNKGNLVREFGNYGYLLQLYWAVNGAVGNEWVIKQLVIDSMAN